MVSTHQTPSPVVVVMGVSAVGKSSVARALARLLDSPWQDADDLHPAANVAKMASGEPLTDDDRWPWLDAVGHALADADGGLVMACSALRRSYRDRLRTLEPRAVFVHLSGSRALLAERASAREGHFMPSALLDSQLATLEPLDADEPGVVLDVSASVAEIATRAAEWVASR